MEEKYGDNYIASDMTEYDDKMINNYGLAGKLHPDFLPFPTYDMHQLGLPYADHGGMVVKIHGGTDENDVLQPSDGMWMKVSDFKMFLQQFGGMDAIRRVSQRNNPEFQPEDEDDEPGMNIIIDNMPEPKTKKTKKKSVKKKSSKK